MLIRKSTTKIILHHSLTEDNKTVSWDDIKKYHVEVRGWEDIGYHFGVEEIEGKYFILVGRPLHLVGSHTEGHNLTSVGICFVGNYDEKEPADEMLILAVEKLIIPIMYIFNINVNNIYGHRDFANKTCPGKLFNIEKVKNLIKERESMFFMKKYLIE